MSLFTNLRGHMLQVLICLCYIFVTFEVNSEENSKIEVSANEDLMREHGILNRLLLIYQEIAHRIEHNKAFNIDSLYKAAKIARDFVEDYHEKLEEEFIFPHFEKAKEQVTLVGVLKDQHNAGRQITDYVLSHANSQTIQDEEQKHILSHYLRLYVRMFRPHEAREDTVLFPAFRKLISQAEYDKLGDRFEDIEEEHFGKNGFEAILSKVADIEKELGIYNLAQFTPKLEGNKK